MRCQKRCRGLDAGVVREVDGLGRQMQLLWPTSKRGDTIFTEHWKMSKGADDIADSHKNAAFPQTHLRSHRII
jgi:hypothetical protein